MAGDPNLIGGGRLTRAETSGDKRRFEGKKLNMGALLLRLWRYIGRNRVLVILAVAGQWKLRVFLRMRRYDRGGNNARVLAMWQDVEKYARLLGTTPGAEYLELARKARFSQHRLSKEEVAAMTFGLKDLRRTLWRENRWKRLYAPLILALY